MAKQQPAQATSTAEEASKGVVSAQEQQPGGQVAQAGAGSRALALPSDLAAELAGEANDAAAKERPAISRLSLRSGVLSYMGNALKERHIDVVLLWGTVWHKFYSQRFDPNNIVNPTCFAVGEDEDTEMTPHENVEEPQSGFTKNEAGDTVRNTCASCPKFQWGTATRDGLPTRGKACRETRRLVLIPKAALESPEAVLKAELAIVDVPVTSLKKYGQFVNTLAVSVKRPMYTVVTRLEIVPDLDSQFKLEFTPIDMVNDSAVVYALREKRKEALRAAVIPYDETYLQGESDDKNAPMSDTPTPTGASAKFRAKK
jgi:hypothetical protein